MVLSDEELLYLIMSGCEFALIELYNIYYRLVWRVVYDTIYKESYLIDAEDVAADALLIFVDLLYQYRTDSKATLRTYMKTCIKHKVYTSIRKQYRILVDGSQTLYLDDIVDDSHTLGQYVLVAPSQSQPDVAMMISEKVEEYNQQAIDLLTAKEKAVYKYLKMGFSAKDISEILNISLKSSYNAIYRITKKLSNFNMTLTRQTKCDKLK